MSAVLAEFHSASYYKNRTPFPKSQILTAERTLKYMPAVSRRQLRCFGEISFRQHILYHISGNMLIPLRKFFILFSGFFRQFQLLCQKLLT